MTTAFFDPQGDSLTAQVVFLGDLIADYGISLKEKNSNNQTTILEGDNINPENDSIVLPTPVFINDGRRVKLETLFFGNHPDVNKGYEIRLEIYQGDNLIGTDIDKSDETNFLTGKAQPSLLLVTLLAKLS